MNEKNLTLEERKLALEEAKIEIEQSKMNAQKVATRYGTKTLLSIAMMAGGLIAVKLGVDIDPKALLTAIGTGIVLIWIFA